MVAAVAAVGFATVAGANGQVRHRADATAIMRVPTGGAIGRVQLTSLAGGRTRVRAVLRRGTLEPGFHGFHVHARGSCNRMSRKAAGQLAPYERALGHFNPGNRPHGQHAGDLPPLYVTRGNRAVLELETDAFSVRDLLDADGSALIVHGGRDNQAQIPERYRSEGAPRSGPDDVTLATGDSGPRVSCGAVRRVR
jgi:Cu-Zn family superoxide dismutase